MWSIFGRGEVKPAVPQSIDINKTIFDPADALHIAHVKEAINKFNRTASNLKTEDLKYGGVFVLYLLTHYALLNSYLAIIGYVGLAYSYKEDKLFDRKQCEEAFKTELYALEKIYAWVGAAGQDSSQSELVRDVEAALRPYLQPKFENGKWHFLYNNTRDHLKAATDSVFEHAHAIKDDAIMVYYGKEPAGERLREQLRPM